MASTASSINAAILREASAPSVRRSRWSLHFSTPRTRRWLLVQLVSVDETTQESTPLSGSASRHAGRCETTRSHLVDDFRNARATRDWI